MGRATAAWPRRLDEADLRRAAPVGGILPLTAEEGLALFDAGAGAPASPHWSRRASTARALRARPRRHLPPLLRGLVRAPARRRGRATAAAPASLADRLAGLPRRRARADRSSTWSATQVAAVLGHASGDAIDPRPRLQGARLRLADRRRAAQPRSARHRPAAAGHPDLRPPDPERAGRATLVDRARRGRPASPRRGPPHGAAAADEPIAIVGMGCRYPGGVDSPEDLWQLVADGGDAIAPFPDDRGWDLEDLYDPDPDQPGTSYTREGGFLHDAAEFDPAFFGISPREALAMDPQQRLLLETSWEAFERAGIDPAVAARQPRPASSPGSMYHDYVDRLGTVPEDLEGYLATAPAQRRLRPDRPTRSAWRARRSPSTPPAPPRWSRCTWPCRRCGSGECSLALAGGVTVMATPGTFVEFSRQRGLAADGRCKSFAAAADGTGWAEGVGRAAARAALRRPRNGHPVLAVVRGSRGQPGRRLQRPDRAQRPRPSSG